VQLVKEDQPSRIKLVSPDDIELSQKMGEAQVPAGVAQSMINHQRMKEMPNPSQAKVSDHLAANVATQQVNYHDDDDFGSLHCYMHSIIKDFAISAQGCPHS
jgi:hypothetical protein